MSEHFQVHLAKEQLVFSAAHFITFSDGTCERLHGHNYRVQCRLAGRLEPGSYVVDFILLRDRLMEILAELDHRVLLPTRHPQIRVERSDAEVVARFEQRRWVFPAEDCALLPVDNTTAERLAESIGRQLLERLTESGLANFTMLELAVDENHGQWGLWTWHKG